MQRSHDHSNAIRKIVLPSGRAIDVIRFDGRVPQAPARQLHVCPDCACTMVQPSEWRELEQHGWQVTLDCPNCGWFETGSFPDDEIEALEERLDAGVSAMIADLQRLAHANMAGDVERFIGALNADVILPEDFQL